MLRRSLPSISPCVRASINFMAGLLMAAFTWSAVATFTVPALTVNARGATIGAAALVGRCSAVHLPQPPSTSATFE